MGRRGAVIFLHGSGDTGPGVREWLESASVGKFCRRLAELGLGPGVFPTAPARPYTLAGGTPSRVWFDREELFPSSRQDRAGVLQSLQQVEEEVRKLEVSGVPRSGIFVGGFSMGGCLALELLANQSVSGRLAGVFSHASFLNDDSLVFEAGSSKIPVYISHGSKDGMVEVAWGRATAERLKARGFDVKFVEHEGLDHEVGGEQVAELLDWISSITKRPGFGGKNPRSAAGDATRCPLGEKADAVDGIPSEEQGRAGRPCSVSYELTELERWNCRATFSVPPGSEELLSGASVCARGAFFQLEIVPGTPGKVSTVFLSPKPEATADAIAARIEQRLEDPRPPGVDEACCLS